MELSIAVPKETIRPSTPFPTLEMDLRTPSILYNHGGYYAPYDPKTCTMPSGPCSVCQDRINMQEAAETLVALSKTCCYDRPSFLEPCPSCGSARTYKTHASRGISQVCNGCDDKVCTECLYGARYFCPCIQPLAPPSSPIQRQTAIGVQSPRREETVENK